MKRVGILLSDLFDEREFLSGPSATQAGSSSAPGWCGASGFSSIRDELVNAGGLYQEAGVVVDGNLVTAQDPGDLPGFVLAFLELLAKG